MKARWRCQKMATSYLCLFVHACSPTHSIDTDGRDVDGAQTGQPVSAPLAAAEDASLGAPPQGMQANGILSAAGPLASGSATPFVASPKPTLPRATNLTDGTSWDPQASLPRFPRYAFQEVVVAPPDAVDETTHVAIVLTDNINFCETGSPTASVDSLTDVLITYALPKHHGSATGRVLAMTYTKKEDVSACVLSLSSPSAGDSVLVTANTCFVLPWALFGEKTQVPSCISFQTNTCHLAPYVSDANSPSLTLACRQY